MTILTKMQEQWKLTAGEMRRYLKPVTLILCGLLLFFFGILLNISVEKFGRDMSGATYELQKSLYERFGTTLDADERAQIVSDADALNREYNALIEQYLGEYDIHSEDDYDLLVMTAQDTEEERYDEAAARWGAENLTSLSETCWAILADKEPLNHLNYQRRAMASVIQYFKAYDRLQEEYRTTGTVKMELDGSGAEANEKTLAPLLADLKRDKVSLLSVNSHWLFFRDCMRDEWGLLIFMLCAFVTVPLLIGNRLEGVQPMQLTSREGRRVLPRQLGAAVGCAVLVNLAADLVFYLVFFHGQYDTGFLLDCPVNAGALGERFVFDLTYRQFVELSFADLLAVSLLLTCAVFVMSYFCKNYIVAAAVSIPLVIVCNGWYGELTKYGYPFHYRAMPFAVLTLLPAAAVVAAVCVFIWKTRREDYLYG